MSTEKRLIILLGPTGVGKTEHSICLAGHFHSPVISCDSRQLYREMTIGTAVPSKDILSAAKHYFIQDHSLSDGVYTAGKYEVEALALCERLFSQGHDTLVMVGGSCFYIDALVDGLDNFPPSDMELRKSLTDRLKNEGLEALVDQLHTLDEESCKVIDLKNSQRVVRALEVCIQTGRPFSSFKSGTAKKRNFRIDKIGLEMPRETLYKRIESRVDGMLSDGLVEEVKSLEQWRSHPALQTVGYQEIFPFLDGEYGIERAVELIKRNTRRYAKRQLSWWGRDKSIRWQSALDPLKY